MNNEQAHILKPTKDRPFPTVFYFLDTETTLTPQGHKIKVHNLKMGNCQKYNRVGDFDLEKKDEIFITSPIEFMDWLSPQLRSKSHSYIIAHNIVYDATILDLFRLFPKIGFTLQSLYS